MKVLYFFVGTRAELMKLYNVINEAHRRGYNCKIISTGQNDLDGFSFMDKTQARIDISISAVKGKEKSTANYLNWFLKTAISGRRQLKQYLNNQQEDSLFVVHGDTLTTTLGAWMCKSLHIPYVHIESGLRSFNFFSPFPEELDRFYGSLHSEINFCPGKEYTNYAAERFKGRAVNTYQNTGIETLYDALNENGSSVHKDQPDSPYFMFMLHRQENVMSKSFVEKVTAKILLMADSMPCVFIYHEQTKRKMVQFGVFEKFVNHKNITMLPNQPYNDFIKLVYYSEFVATDGCGNQQEFFYLGKPYLILRKAVEKNSEGLGINAKLFNNDFESIPKFLSEYAAYTKNMIAVNNPKPSQIILDEIEKWFNN